MPNYSTLQHILGPLYEGDEVAPKIKQDGDKEETKTLKLHGIVTAYVNSFLGVLPMRDDPGPGVEVRHVYPKSPADGRGHQGRRSHHETRLADTQCRFKTARQLATAMQRLNPGVEVQVEVEAARRAGRSKR